MRYKYIMMTLAFGLYAAEQKQLPREVMTRGILTLATFILYSDDFKPNEHIKSRFTCDGLAQGSNQATAPVLRWIADATNIAEFALIMEDPDAPGPEPFVHWIVYNIPTSARAISRQLKRSLSIADGTKQGKNSFGNIGYDGPCPPKGDEHQYVFTLYALERPISLNSGATKKELIATMKNQSNIIQTAQLICTYKH